MKRLFLAAAIALSLVGVASCLDTTPVTVDATSMLPPSHPDGGVDAAPDVVTVTQACQTCLETMCADQFASCQTTPRCPEVFSCANELGCFLVRFKDATACGTPCAKQAGVTSAEDPAIPLLIAFFGCAAGACQSVCQPTDGT